MRAPYLTAVALLLVLAACGSAAKESRVWYEPNLPAQGLNIEGGPIAVAELYHSYQQTVNLVRCEGPIAKHRHMHSEETVYLVSGEGVLHMDGTTREVRAGDLVVVPRNTVHGFTPTGDGPAVVLSVFTPAFQEGDRRFEDE